MGSIKTHDRLAASLSQKMERAALKNGVQGRSPWCSFLHFSQEKWRPPAGIPPGALRPEVGKSLDHP